GGATHITDKLPANFIHLGLIRLILPNARIIHCTRDPLDNCLSIYKTLFSVGHAWSYDMRDLGAYYRAYQELMKHWESVLPGAMLNVSYEALVADQRGQTERLLKHCELPWDDACLAFHKTGRRVATASNAQVRRPIYKDSISLSQQYGALLNPLRKSLGLRA
ncbi:MAG: sulfotransferase family protein, partial [Gammaproteobacteria bacterium]